MRRMSTKSPPPIFTETCTQCGAAIPVSETLYLDGENKRCPRCGGTYQVPQSPKWQQLGN
jgi:rRNA maturation protein Nop10